MQRLRLFDVRLSRLPTAIGLCVSDIAGIAAVANSAERRLIGAKEAGDEGWHGSFAEMAFNVSRAAPYLTTPRNVARLELTAICDYPIRIQNQFYEYLQFGNGRMPKRFRQGCCKRPVQVYSRNFAPGFVDLSNPPQYIAVYPTNPVDYGTRVLVQGTDSTGADLYSMDGTNRVKGWFVTIQAPFSVVQDFNQNPIPFYSMTGYQKDGTLGTVQFQQLDPNTGAQVLLHTMDPGETTGWYRRYYFDGLPFDCCCGSANSTCATSTPPAQIQVTAIAKLDPVPVRFDTDYFLLQNLEALIEECQGMRYGDMDTADAKAFEQRHHAKAIGLLNGELAHIYGKDSPAVNFRPFGSARLERQKIGLLI